MTAIEQQWRPAAAVTADVVATRREEFLRQCRNSVDNAVLDRLEVDLAGARDLGERLRLVTAAAAVLSGAVR